ncbi:MAG: hypothetical protein Q9195_007655 [Heterodermia aff. obscurata]
MHHSFSISVISAFNILIASYVATIPFLSSGPPYIANTNTSSIEETLQLLSGQEHMSPVSKNTTFQVKEPWPPAPFNFESEKSPGWSLNIRSYETAQLIYRQKWALLSICTEYIKSLTRVRDIAKMPARTVVMVTDETTPTDLSREDVEIAFFNSAGEPGAEFRVGDTIETLRMISRTVVTGDMRELVRTVAHYAEGRPTTLGISKARSSGLQAAYFGAYPLASLGHANFILRHFGYKAVFIWGLCLYGVGALIAWPCLLHRSFGGFCAAIFVIGNGLGSLETAANPYLAVCGPPRYSEIRINLAQAFNAVGTVIAPVLGSYAFFKNVGDNGASLQNVQWVYLAIACFVFFLAIIFYFSTIPEITDADMMFQFCYTGAQVAIAGYFINYATEVRAHTSSATGAIYLAVAQGCFAIGRFSGSIMMHFIRPRWVFLAYLTCVIIFNAAATTQNGNTGIAMLSLTLFFESVCFPTIVALGIRGIGRHTKRGSGLIVAGVSGGAVVPPILGASADAKGTATAMVVPMCFMIAAWSYALCVNFVPSYRNPADQIGAGMIGIRDDDRASDADVEARSDRGQPAGAEHREGELRD